MEFSGVTNKRNNGRKLIQTYNNFCFLSLKEKKKKANENMSDIKTFISWEEGAQIVEDLENDKIDQVESLDPIDQ